MSNKKTVVKMYRPAVVDMVKDYKLAANLMVSLGHKEYYVKDYDVAFLTWLQAVGIASESDVDQELARIIANLTGCKTTQSIKTKAGFIKSWMTTRFKLVTVQEIRVAVPKK